MIALVQTLQALSGALWLVLAIFLSPRIIASWRMDADKLVIVSARNGWLAFLMAGFSVRWLVWPRAMDGMGWPEMTCWAALYAYSFVLAFWFLTGAIQNRGR